MIQVECKVPTYGDKLFPCVVIISDKCFKDRVEITIGDGVRLTVVGADLIRAVENAMNNGLV